MVNQARRRQAPSKANGVTQKATKKSEAAEHNTTRESSPLRGILKALYFLLLAGGIFYYYTRTAGRQNYIQPRIEDGAFLAPVRVVKLAGKGMGVVALRDIPQGELVLREKPLFVVPSKVSMSPGALLLSSLATLTPAKRASFYNLSYVNFREDLEPGTDTYNEELALAIFQTNAVSAATRGVGIFPHMARLNHGCSSAFNAVYTWRDDEGVLVVHTLKPVKAGEELLTTYTDTKQPRHIRRQFLREHYGFDCGCSVCALSDDLSALSDKRLMSMTELYAQFSNWQHHSISGREAATAAVSIWRLGDEEGYWSGRGQLAADVVHVAAAHSDALAAREWARLARRWFSYELGADSGQARAMERIAAQPPMHAAWGTRHRETVGAPEPWMLAGG